MQTIFSTSATGKTPALATAIPLSISARPQPCGFRRTTRFSAKEPQMTATPKAHGMSGTLVEPDWPVLTVNEVRTLLENFPAQAGPVETLSVSPRPFSAASVVSTRGGRILIKRHHRLVRDCEGLLEEHRFIEHLRAHAAAVPRVLVSAS